MYTPIKQTLTKVVGQETAIFGDKTIAKASLTNGYIFIRQMKGKVLAKHVFTKTVGQ